jgi:hypothetical protein
MHGRELSAFVQGENHREQNFHCPSRYKDPQNHTINKVQNGARVSQDQFLQHYQAAAMSYIAKVGMVVLLEIGEVKTTASLAD